MALWENDSSIIGGETLSGGGVFFPMGVSVMKHQPVQVIVEKTEAIEVHGVNLNFGLWSCNT